MILQHILFWPTKFNDVATGQPQQRVQQSVVRNTSPSVKHWAFGTSLASQGVRALLRGEQEGLATKNAATETHVQLAFHYCTTYQKPGFTSASGGRQPPC